MTNPAENVNPAAANIDPLAGIEVPPVLEGVVDGLFVRMAGGSLTQREVDLIAMGVEMVDAQRARAGQVVGATAAEAAVAATPATPPAEKVEAKPVHIDKVMSTYPSRLTYAWDGEAQGGFTTTSTAGSRLYAELSDENTQLPDIGVPSGIAERESRVTSKGKVSAERELVGFTVVPEEHAAELRPYMDLPEGTNPNLNLVTFEYSVSGTLSAADGYSGTEADSVGVQVTVPYDVAMRLSLLVHKNPRAARDFVEQALKEEVEQARGTQYEQDALEMQHNVLGRFKSILTGIDKRPGAHMMVLTDMPGQGVPAEDGYVRHQLPLAPQAGSSAPAPAAQGHPGGAIGAVAGAVLGFRRKRSQ